MTITREEIRERDISKSWTPWNVRHLFHLVTPSPWPIIMSLSVFITVVGGTTYFHRYQFGLALLICGLIMIFSTMFVWFRDVIREAIQGHHTLIVQRGLRYGVVFFILSEAMFFLGIFWAYFHSVLVPTIEIGSIWPPRAIETFNPFAIPLINTLILLTSGLTLTLAHHELVAGARMSGLKNRLFAKILSVPGFLAMTVLLGVIFTGLQVVEYVTATFTISDSIYGSTFYFATGFHGIHVIIGTILLIVAGARAYFKHFTPTSHVGLEAAAWYWHFVDVVWIILYISIYLNSEIVNLFI